MELRLGQNVTLDGVPGIVTMVGTAYNLAGRPVPRAFILASGETHCVEGNDLYRVEPQ